MIEQKLSLVSDTSRDNEETLELLGRRGYVATRLSTARAVEYRRMIADGLITPKPERPSKSALWSLD
ncbi:hypothetical protein K2P56_04440 [Patescibacteria group bacterium]|nr:hypothetical protein [Patescibacteria group bacterium]